MSANIKDYVANRVIEYLKEKDDVCKQLNKKLDDIHKKLELSSVYMCNECEFYASDKDVNKCDNCRGVYCIDCTELMECADCGGEVCENCFVEDKNRCKLCQKENKHKK